MTGLVQEIPSLLKVFIGAVKDDAFGEACTYYQDFVAYLRSKSQAAPRTDSTMLCDLTDLQERGMAAAEGIVENGAAPTERSLGSAPFRNAIVNDLMELEAFLQQVSAFRRLTYSPCRHGVHDPPLRIFSEPQKWTRTKVPPS